MKRAAAKREEIEPVADPNDPAIDESMADAIDERASGKGKRVERQSVQVRLGGKEYRLRSEASEESLQRVADYVDHAMQKIRERTDTVDSQDIALLASLNLAREVLQLREQVEAGGGGSGERLQSLIERVEAALPADRP